MGNKDCIRDHDSCFEVTAYPQAGQRKKVGSVEVQVCCEDVMFPQGPIPESIFKVSTGFLVPILILPYLSLQGVTK